MNFIARLAGCWIAGLLLLFGIGTAALGQPASPWTYTITDPGFTVVRLGTVARIDLSDTQRRLAAADMEAQFGRTGGLVMTKHDAEVGRFSHPVWARLELRNNSGKDLDFVLYHAQPTIEDYRAFRKTGAEWVRMSGHHETATGAFQRYRGPSYDLKLANGASADLLIRSDTYAPIIFPLELRSHAEHQEQSHIELAMYTVATMLPLLVVMALLLLRRVSSVRIDLLFILFVCADMLGAAWITGTLSILFPRSDPALLRLIGLSAYCLLGVLAIAHSIRFLALGQLCPRWATALKLWALGGIVVMSLSLIFNLAVASRVMLGFNFTTSALVAGTCLYAWRRGVAWAATYFAAWAIYLLSGIIYLLYRLDLLPLLAFGFAVFWQNAGVCLALGGAVIMSVFARDTRLQDALNLAAERQHQLELSNRERDRLFAAASHDLRQPLQAMAMNLSLLSPNSQEQLAVSERFRLAIVSMGDILSSLLDLRRASGDGLTATLQAVDLAPLLARLRDDYREPARLKQISFKYVPTHASVLADPIWLERILRNLITNALRYTDQGRVLLGVRRSGSAIRICVIDTGRGLSKAQMAMLQSDMLAAPNPELRDSYGLGLFIVKRLSQKMNARLVVRSQVNAGSVFEIWLPLADRLALTPADTAPQ